MLRIVIVDDEPLSLMELAFLLKEINEVNVIASFTNPHEAIVNIRELMPDIVFLDIEMPQVDGFQVLESISNMKKLPKIVFSTAYSEFAVKAFEFNVVDYITKPYSKDRIVKTIRRVLMENDRVNLKKIQSKKIISWKNGRMFLLNPDEILFCWMEEKEINVVTKYGNGYKFKGSLSLWEEKLKLNRFFRCHKSYIINVNHVSEIIPETNNTCLIKMRGNNTEIPVSRSYIKEFKKIFNI